MKKESRVIFTEEQHAAAVLAADDEGMALSTFLRHLVIKVAKEKGFHTSQPKVD